MIKEFCDSCKEEILPKKGESFWLGRRLPDADYYSEYVGTLCLTCAEKYKAHVKKTFQYHVA